MNITTDNNNSHHGNLSITNCTVESPKVLINEPSSPFHQTKAFNPFNFHDNYSITKPLSSKSYYSQIVDYKLLQTLPNGRMSPNTSSYSFHSKSLYSPQMHSQSPKQYENVLSPTFQPSNKLTVVETTKQPVVEVKKAKSTKSKSKSENKSKKSIKIDLLKETVISSSPPTQPTNNNNTSKSTDTIKPKQLKAKSKSKKKISSSSSPSITSCVDNINSRIVYPNLDLSSIFNDDDFYDSSLVCFSLKDTMNKMYIKNLRILKPNLTPNVDSDELISLKDILLPSEVIKDIQLPKRKLELSSVVLIGDSDSENEESKDKSDHFSMNVRKKIKLEENPKIEIENEVHISNNNNNNNNNNNSVKSVEDDIRKDNYVDNICETPFYTSYERFLDDCRSGKLVVA